MNTTQSSQNQFPPEVSRAYTPSGKCPLFALLLMVPFCLLGSIVAGSLGSIMGLFLTWSFWTGIDIPFVPLGRLVWWALIGPFFMGVISGLIIEVGIKKGRCRNPNVNLVCGLLSGIFSCLVMVTLFMLIDGVDFKTYLGSWGFIRGHYKSVSPGVVEWVVLSLQVLIAAISAGFAIRVNEQPFCEKCNCWFTEKTVLTTDANEDEKVYSSIRSNTLSILCPSWLLIMSSNSPCSLASASKSAPSSA